MAESGMRWEQAAAEICEAVENSAAKIARNAADSLYETVMVSVQDYLRENVEFNLSSKLQGYADTAHRLRVENEQLKHRADLVEPLVEALRVAIRVADEAREEWDRAPSGMKAGKLLIALSDSSLKYRADITAIHTALSSWEAGQ